MQSATLPMKTKTPILLLAGLLIVSRLCAQSGALPPEGAYGPSPTLPPPEKYLIPTVEVAKPKPWQAGQTPIVASGLSVTAFAMGLEHPRQVYALPNGDLLVVETNAPERP